jgi:ribosomal-protein-alanine N-acetyltransferase
MRVLRSVHWEMDAHDGIEIEISQMVRADLESVLEIEKASFSTPWSRYAFLAELCENKRARYFVACEKEQGKVVGYVGIWLVLNEGHITTIAVHPDYRRKGIGKKLMLAAIEFAESSGVDAVTLEVRVSNTGAQNLYKQIGFISVGIRPGYYHDNREDAVIMWRKQQGK